MSINSLEGANSKNIDFALLKTIPLGKSRRFELRAEAFNAFDHTNFLFAAPGPQNSINSTVVGTPSFGFLTGVLAPRLLQLASSTSKKSPPEEEDGNSSLRWHPPQPRAIPPAAQD